MKTVKYIFWCIYFVVFWSFVQQVMILAIMDHYHMDSEPWQLRAIVICLCLPAMNQYAAYLKKEKL